MDKLLSGKRILVVEDEMLVLIMIEDMLAELGCKSVTSAGTVNKALVLIGTESFDAAMLDMNLNGNNSAPVANALVAKGVPFIYSTGNGGLHMKDGYPDRPVLRKPFRYDDLVELLTGLIQSPDKRHGSDGAVAAG